jgi:hypothetical protein
MKNLWDFFLLKPIWTRRSIEAVWYAYLIATIFQLITFFGFFFSSIGAVGTAHFFSLAGPVMFSLLHLLLVRILLEIALKYLATAEK